MGDGSGGGGEGGVLLLLAVVGVRERRGTSRRRRGGWRRRNADLGFGLALDARRSEWVVAEAGRRRSAAVDDMATVAGDRVVDGDGGRQCVGEERDGERRVDGQDGICLAGFVWAAIKADRACCLGLLICSFFFIGLLINSDRQRV